MLSGHPAPAGGSGDRRLAPPCPGDAVFAGLERTTVVLAVSGGPDSMALMHLAAQWGAARLHVATVDHGLRPCSRAEAEAVARAAAALGLPHAILPWLGPRPRARIQERARAARYALLAGYALRVGATHVLTAHHADDQAETVLMRMGRGSGLGGLAGMRRESALAPGLTLMRPLLCTTKAALVAVCAAAGQSVVDDPSNRDPAFARAALRAQAPAAAALGLDTSALTRLAARLARADDALEAEARRAMALLDARRTPGLFEATLAPLAGAAPEILLRVMRLVIAEVAGKMPRLDRLETLASALHQALRAGQPLRATLTGTCVRLRRDTVLTVVPEAERRRGRPSRERRQRR